MVISIGGKNSINELKMLVDNLRRFIFQFLLVKKGLDDGWSTLCFDWLIEFATRYSKVLS